jgi:muramoyltetrapeptide carboxypeptidase
MPQIRLVRPPRLEPGDVVRVVAPAGPLPRDEFEAGTRILERRYRLRYDRESLFRSEGFLAGPDEHRVAELQAALSDPDAKAVFLARGGYGLLRLLPFLQLHDLRHHPRSIVGFSDGTALLAQAARAGVASIHGPVITQVPRLPEEDLQALYALLERPGPAPLLDGLDPLMHGRVQGPLLGGNLEVFSRLLGTAFLPDLTGAILFFEEIGERPYRVDRLITHLDLAGVFNAVSAVVVGDLVDCQEREGSKLPSPPVAEVIEERLGRLAIPVAVGGRFGHGTRNLSLPYGTVCELDTRQGTLVALEGAVS